MNIDVHLKFRRKNCPDKVITVNGFVKNANEIHNSNVLNALKSDNFVV